MQKSIMKKSSIARWFMLVTILGVLMLPACGLDDPTSGHAGDLEELIPENVSVSDSREAISEAVRDYLARQGNPADQVEVEIERLEDDFARVKIISTDPDVPGGFTGFLKRQDGIWTTLIVGSDFNPLEIEALGIPESILPEGWIYPDGETPTHLK
jgi:hypothetical protein